MNQHEDCLSRAQDYFDGRLDPGPSALWEAHRAACPDCRAVLERWPKNAAVPDFRGRVLTLTRPCAPDLAPAPESRRSLGWLLPLGSALAMLLLISAFWHPERQWVRDDLSYNSTCELQVQGGQACCAN
jgi:anti-sigma factor RsiW